MRRLRTYSRALRWPFLTASVLPYIYGALRADRLDPLLFVLGFVGVGATHLSANLMNDVGDAEVGVDALDMRYFGVFGGSKLIQEGVLPVDWYRMAAYAFAAIGFLGICLAGILRRDWLIPGVFALALAASWAYTRGPWRLSYHHLGEATVFVLFGPVAVLGGAYLQGVPLSAHLCLESLPFGLLTAAILIANEVPDCADDAAAGKHTLVTLIGARNGHLLYGIVSSLAITVGMLPAMDTEAWWALPAAWAGAALVLVAWRIMRRHWSEKQTLVVSSRLAIAAHMWVSTMLIAGVLG